MQKIFFFNRIFKRSEEGQAIVESVIVLPIFLLLFFGIIFFGEYTVKQSRAYMAARYASWKMSKSGKNSLLNMPSTYSDMVSYRTNRDLDSYRAGQAGEILGLFNWLIDRVSGTIEVEVSSQIDTPSFLRLNIGANLLAPPEDTLIPASVDIKAKCVVDGHPWSYQDFISMLENVFNIKLSW